MSPIILIAVLWLVVPTGTRALVTEQPEQIHLSYGASEYEMQVTWVTQAPTNSSVVMYGWAAQLHEKRAAVRQQFLDGGPEQRVLYIYRALMSPLQPGEKYVYRVGSPSGWSALFFFTAKPAGNNWSPRLAVFGDMGNDNAQSLPFLQDETERGHFDAVLHVGDFAYNMDSSAGRVGDAYMRQVEAVAAYVPYMTVVGNHESAYNFSHYVNRFSMPGGSKDNMFYSFDMGPVHFVSFSSEFYYYLDYGWEQIPRQYAWLEKDLREASRPENRKKRPWIITMCHRPMYCSNSDDPEHCPNPENIIRVGLPLLHAYAPEVLLYKYGVDLHFQAHEHSYERLWPVYNNTGCDEKPDPFSGQRPPWSAMRSDDYGYTRMTVHNATHLHLEQVSVDKVFCSGASLGEYGSVKMTMPWTFSVQSPSDITSTWLVVALLSI